MSQTRQAQCFQCPKQTGRVSQTPSACRVRRRAQEGESFLTFGTHILMLRTSCSQQAPRSVSSWTRRLERSNRTQSNREGNKFLTLLLETGMLLKRDTKLLISRSAVGIWTSISKPHRDCLYLSHSGCPGRLSHLETRS